LLRGIYSSAAGMVMEMEKVSMHAQNIANAQSAGFRGREMSSIPFKELMINIMEKQDGKGVQVPIGTGAGSSLLTLDATQGSLKNTGNTFDVAIDGNGFLTFNKGAKPGEAEYTTRNGRMLLNNDGYIINADGHYLVDQLGKSIKVPLAKGVTMDQMKKGIKPEVIPPNDPRLKSIQGRITIDENGKVFDSGKLLALLKIQADTNKLQSIPELGIAVPIQTVLQRDAKTGDLIQNLTGKTSKDLPPGQKDTIAIKQGYLEDSNIQIITEMVGLITSSKDYESGHKLIMAEDKVLDKAINELGRTG